MTRKSAPLVTVNSAYMKSDRVNLVAPASPVHRAGTVKTGTGMVDPARIFKCTAAARGECSTFSLNVHSILTLVQSFVFCLVLVQFLL